MASASANRHGKHKGRPISKKPWFALLWILAACGISAHWCNIQNWYPDFKAVYFGSKCLLEGHNPYHQSELEAVYNASGAIQPSEPPITATIITLYVNLPTTLLLVAPFALLTLGPAHIIWLSLAAGILILAGFLIWRIGAEHAPTISLFLICFLLANYEFAFRNGNTAMLVVGLCTMAAWCIAEDRSAWAGVLFLAASLAIKPHDSGLIWLYFLLLGGIWRRRALQALGITAGLGLVAFTWITIVSPQWMFYWRLNLANIAAPGGLNMPGPYFATGYPGVEMVLNLQSAVMALWNNPRLGNIVSYLVCSAMLVVWVMRVMRAAKSRANIWLGLAAVVAPELLISYHRAYDMKLLLLAVPACAMLWRGRGAVRWLALGLTTAAVVLVSDMPLIVLYSFTGHTRAGTGNLLTRLLAMVSLEPTPLILLAMGIFYLWAYVKSDALFPISAESDIQNDAPAAIEPAQVAAAATGTA